jgi:sentrin-specific protease 1
LNDLEAALVSLKKMKKEAEKSFERLTRTSFKLHENQSVSHCQMTGLEEFLMSHEITEVSAEEIKALCRKVDTKGGDDYFSQIKEFTLNYRDVRMLRKSCWLNDQVINAYISLIKPVANVHVFNTYFFQYVESMGEEIDVNKLKRIIARAGLDSLADKPYVVIPANVFHNHWIVLAINNLNLTIEYYDSKGTRNMEIICAKLERALVQLGIGPYDWEGIDVPYQQNSSDCGIFAAKIVQCLATNSEFLFDADDMKYFRKVMIYELKKAKLL